MKKSIIALAAFAAITVSCQKAEIFHENDTTAIVDETYSFEFKFNGLGFDAATKADATVGWTTGEKIFIFFKPDGGSILDSYLTLSYDGSEFVMSGSTVPYGSLGTGGKLSAVYVPYLADDVVPVYNDGIWSIAGGDVYYSCADNASYYTINSSVIVSSIIAMSIPDGYVQFAVPATKAAEGDMMSCNLVDAYNCVTLGSDLKFNDTAVEGGKMSGHKVGDKVYFWGKKNDITEDNCDFILNSSVTECGLCNRFEPNTLSGSARISKNKAYNIDFIHFYPSDSDILPGVFSVSPEKKVRFIKGNLYFDGNVFKCEDKQYDYRTYQGNNSCINGVISETGTPSGNWGLFGWSGSPWKKPIIYGMSISTDDLSDSNDYDAYGSFKDWGCLYTRTLTIKEWQYLFSYNSSSDYVFPYNGDNDTRRGKYKTGVSVCGNTGCVVIAPDDFTGTIESSYDTDSWTVAEASGLVCLACAGSREGATVQDVGTYGFYWSSSPRQLSWSYCVYIKIDGIIPKLESKMHCGYSVRLVIDYEE